MSNSPGADRTPVTALKDAVNLVSKAINTIGL